MSSSLNNATTVLIIGGYGNVARYLTTMLRDRGYNVHSLIRNSRQTSFLTAMGATPHVQSIEDASVTELSLTIRRISPDVIVWSAGAGGGDPLRTDSVDREGAIKAMDAAAQAGVKRYIVVSALDVRDRENKPVPDWYDQKAKEGSDKLWRVLKPYMHAKLAADKALVQGNDKRGLKYTIVRPGPLSGERGTGKVELGKVEVGKPVSREDVASVILQCIEDDKTIGLAFDVVGGETPVNDAVQKVAEGRIDTFEGYY